RRASGMPLGVVLCVQAVVRWTPPIGEQTPDAGYDPLAGRPSRRTYGPVATARTRRRARCERAFPRVRRLVPGVGPRLGARAAARPRRSPRDSRPTARVPLPGGRGRAGCRRGDGLVHEL